jgi:hypothetical protein
MANPCLSLTVALVGLPIKGCRGILKIFGLVLTKVFTEL